MKNLKKIFSVILVLAIALSVLAGCGTDTPETTEPGSDNTGAAGTYNVTVTTAGGMAMEGLDLYVYADSSLSDLKDYGKTDAEGNEQSIVEAIRQLTEKGTISAEGAKLKLKE